MRQIIFRGKRKDNNKWVTGCLLIEEPPLQCFTSEYTEPNKYLIGKSGFADWNMTRPFTAAEVYPESVGQFTGLKDKNGKDIYENDLVKRNSSIYVIIYSDQIAGYTYSRDGKNSDSFPVY